MRASSARLPSPNVTADPPDHQGHRRLLLPYFSPRNVADLEDALRTYCRELIAAIGDGNRADAAEQYLSLIHISEPTRLDLASRMPSSA